MVFTADAQRDGDVVITGGEGQSPHAGDGGDVAIIGGEAKGTYWADAARGIERIGAYRICWYVIVGRLKND